MSVSLQTVEATMLPDGSIQIHKPINVSEPTQVIVTFAIEKKIPNATTQKSLNACLAGLPDQARFSSVDDLMADLEA